MSRFASVITPVLVLLMFIISADVSDLLFSCVIEVGITTSLIKYVFWSRCLKRGHSVSLLKIASKPETLL